MTQQEAINKVIQIAKSYIGYKEKKTNAQLDDFDANAGSGNWTKFGRDVDNVSGWISGKKNGYAWCATFVHAVFLYAFGYPVCREMLYQPTRSYAAVCRHGVNYYKKHNAWTDSPQPGDQIFFQDGGEASHTGIVIAFDGKKVTTVEGNAGNYVAQKSYALGNTYILGFGRPNWSLVADVPAPSPAPAPSPVPSGHPTLSKGDKGNAVREMQERLIKHGFGLPQYGADGDFGSETESAVRAFQKSRKLEVDGICGPKTWKALDAEPIAPGGTAKTYVVVKGDNLVKIAKAFGTTYDVIAKANGLKYPYVIRVGQTLTIPA